MAVVFKDAQRDMAIRQEITGAINAPVEVLPQYVGGVEKEPLPVVVPLEDTKNQVTLQDKATRASYSDFIATIGESKMRKAFLRMPDPKTWRDIKTLDDIIRRAKGLDKVTGKTAGIFSGAFGVGSFVSEISGPAFAVENDAEEA
jgi:hypothetical protein